MRQNNTYKKIGIVCDNYKVDKFRNALNEERILHEVYPLEKQLTAIVVKVDNDKFDEVKNIIAKICFKFEIQFKNSN